MIDTSIDWTVRAIMVTETMLESCHEAFVMQANPGGGGFTCQEIEDLVAVYRSYGRMEQAQDLMTAHIISDTEGDQHYVGDLTDLARGELAEEDLPA